MTWHPYEQQYNAQKLHMWSCSVLLGLGNCGEEQSFWTGSTSPSLPKPEARQSAKQLRPRSTSYMMHNTNKTCQVPGCNDPLPTNRVYHTRYRICPYHAGLPEMKLDGNVVRFCQQCGRFQALEDFEGNKKSCRSKLKMHNAQRKRAREKAEHKIKRRPTPSTRKSSSSSLPPIMPEQQVTIDLKAPFTPEIEVSILGVHTPVKREASPALNEGLLATAAAKAVVNPGGPGAATATFPAATEGFPLTVGADDRCDMGALTLAEIDTLMEDFNSPLASQISLSIVKKQEEEEELWQQKQRHSSPEAISPELLPPIITMDPPPSVFVQSAAAAVAYNCSPFIRSNPPGVSQFMLAPVVADGAADRLNGSCNMDKLQIFDGADTMQVQEINPLCAENDSLEPELVAASFLLFQCHPSLLPLPIIEHLKRLLKYARN